MIDLPLLKYKEGDYEAFNSGGVEVEVGELLYSFVRILKPYNILDLGTHKGISASYMALACKKNGTGRVTTVEFDSQHWKDAETLWSQIGVYGQVHFIRKTVDEFLKFIKDPSSQVGRPYQMILIDTEPDQRWKQLEDFYEYLTPGGYVFLHDLPRSFCKGNINPDHPELQDWPWGPVPEKILNLLKDKELIPFHFPNPREMCGFYKPRPDDYKY